MKILLLVSMFAVMGFSSQAFASDHVYKCFSYYWNGYDGEKGTMDLALNEASAKGSITSETWNVPSLGGDINPNYRSRGPVKYVKFGTGLIVEETMLTGGKTLKDGSMGGFARVEGRSEGAFYQYKFVCKHLPTND